MLISDGYIPDFVGPILCAVCVFLIGFVFFGTILTDYVREYAGWDCMRCRQVQKRDGAMRREEAMRLRHDIDVGRRGRELDSVLAAATEPAIWNDDDESDVEGATGNK